MISYFLIGNLIDPLCILEVFMTKYLKTRKTNLGRYFIFQIGDLFYMKYLANLFGLISIYILGSYFLGSYWHHPLKLCS